MTTRIRTLAFVFALLSGVARAETELVTGAIRDTGGSPIPGVTVYLRASNDVAVTDERGEFRLTVDVRGDQTLVAMLAGFQAVQHPLRIGAPQRIELVMRQLIRDEIVVRAPSARIDQISGATQLTPLRVLQTAGTKGDMLRGLQMLPGVVQVDEGAGLFVRGGDVSETKIYRDGALIPHPYRFETPTGGYFGTVDPLSISGLSFATGAVPARYGNALSGILELTGEGRPDATEVDLTAGLAAASVSVGKQLGDRAGVRLAGNRTNSQLLFAVNPPEQTFTRYPSGTNFSLSAFYDSARLGTFQTFLYDDRDRVGVQHDTEVFSGMLHSSGANTMGSLGWHRSFGRWSARGVLSRSSHESDLQSGVVDMAWTDGTATGRVDLSRPAGTGLIRIGVDHEAIETSIAGVGSSTGGDFGGTYGTREWELVRTDRRDGAYVEVEQTFGRITANLGGRTDHYHASQEWTLDPRLLVTIALTSSSRIRVAGGIHHQNLDPMVLDPTWGNPALGPMMARTAVLGFEAGEISSPWLFRAEAYAKEYRHLPLEDPQLRFTGSGHGFARGVDLFFKVVRGRWDGWVSYSLLRARRLYTPIENVDRFPRPAAAYSPHFEVPHTLQVTANRSLPLSLTVGGSLRVASGVPFTPIVRGEPEANGWRPVYGSINAERYPYYARLDTSISHVRPLRRIGFVVLYAGFSNLLARRNVFQYVYNTDFSERRPAEASTSRTVYFGTTLRFRPRDSTP